MSSYWEKYSEHTRVKHDILKYYLHLWSNILGSVRRRLVFWDCFAGRGSYPGGHPGSPIIALNQSRECRPKGADLICVFTESDSACFSELTSRLRTLFRDEEGVFWHVYGDNYLEVLGNGQDHVLSELRQYPTLYFLDPIGFKDLPLSAVKKMMSIDRCEVIITLMVEQIRRHCSNHSVAGHFKEMFGVRDLARLQETCRNGDSAYLVEYYEQQLNKHLGSPLYTKSFEFRSKSRQISKYYLVFCTRSEKGLQTMHDSMRAISKNDDLSYRGSEDRSEIGESLEKWLGTDIDRAATWILSQGEKTTNLKRLRYLSHFHKEEAFSAAQLRKAILVLESKGKVVFRLAEGVKRRENTVANHWFEITDEDY